MVITENHIRKIVSESLRRMLTELSVGTVGRSGPIKQADMFVPSKRFAKECQTLAVLKEKKKQNPNLKVNIEQIFGETDAYRIYKNYFNAMMSKEGKKAIGFTTWLKFICNGKKGQPIMGYEVDGSCLFGLWIDGFFLCAYFAPIGFTGMFKVIGGIAQYNNIIFAVTQDMSSMLNRLGIPKAEGTHEAPWRGKTVTKDVFGTSQKSIEKGIEILGKSIEMKNLKKNLKGLADKGGSSINSLMAKYNMLSPEQQKKVREKFLPKIQKNPKFLDKIKTNGIGI